MKLLFGFIIVTVIILMVVALYCALIIKGCSAMQRNEENNKGADDMFFKKPICSKCRIGQKSYELDKHSNSCYYIECLKDGKCSYFEPIEKPLKANIFNKDK